MLVKVSWVGQELVVGMWKWTPHMLVHCWGDVCGKASANERTKIGGNNEYTNTQRHYKYTNVCESAVAVWRRLLFAATVSVSMGSTQSNTSSSPSTSVAAKQPAAKPAAKPQAKKSEFASSYWVFVGVCSHCCATEMDLASFSTSDLLKELAQRVTCQDKKQTRAILIGRFPHVPSLQA